MNNGTVERSETTGTLSGVSIVPPLFKELFNFEGEYEFYIIKHGDNYTKVSDIGCRDIHKVYIEGYLNVYKHKYKTCFGLGVYAFEGKK